MKSKSESVGFSDGCSGHSANVVWKKESKKERKKGNQSTTNPQSANNEMEQKIKRRELYTLKKKERKITRKREGERGRDGREGRTRDTRRAPVRVCVFVCYGGNQRNELRDWKGLGVGHKIDNMAFLLLVRLQLFLSLSFRLSAD